MFLASRSAHPSNTSRCISSVSCTLPRCRRAFASLAIPLSVSGCEWPSTRRCTSNTSSIGLLGFLPHALLVEDLCGIRKYLPRASARDAPGQARHALPPRLLHASPQSASTWFGFSAYTSPQLPPTCLACLGTCKVVHTAKCGLMFLAKLSTPSFQHFPMHLLGFLPLAAHGHRFHLSRWHPVAREKNAQTGAFTLQYSMIAKELGEMAIYRLFFWHTFSARII